MIYKIKYLSYLLCINLLFVLSCSVSAQKNTYLVFLKDKGENSVSSFDFSRLLSQASIARRTAQNISFTDGDLPVWSAYYTAISQLAVVVGQSKWLNALVVQADSIQIASISVLPYVTETMLVKRNSLPAARKENNNRPQIETFTETPNSRTYLQNSWLAVPDMHRLGYKGKNITIAVFDNGFSRINQLAAFKHLFDNQQIIATYNFVRNTSDVYAEGRHGTQVLSVLAGFLPDSFAGVAPDANYILCTTEESNAETRLEEVNWLLAAEFADSAGARIINSSLGYNTFDDATMNYQVSDLGKNVAIVSRAAELASQRGIIVVNSAGNEGNNSQWRRLMFPADAPSVVAVAAANRERRHANFSSWGYQTTTSLKPDIAALGDLTVVVDTNGRIGVNSGTSFASPLIAGFTAGLWQAFPTATALQIRQTLLQTGDRSSNPDTLLGNGIPQFLRAFNLLADENSVILSTITVYPTSFTDEINISFSELYGRKFRLRIIDLAGREFFAIEDTITKEIISLKLPNSIPKGIAFVIIETEGKIKQQKIWIRQ